MVHPTPELYSQSVAKPSFSIDSTLDDLLNETSTHEVKRTVSFDIDSTLDDLLNETSTHEVKSTPFITVPPTQPVSKAELLDDFDS
nr:hypothetical protein [Tanacetum cinerariifolium]